MSSPMRWGAPPLGELGWRGEVKADSAEVVALRETLVAEAGIQGLEIVDPAQPDFAQRAARLFHRDGFVLVKDALDPERLERVKCGCDHVIRKMLELDPERLGNLAATGIASGTRVRTSARQRSGRS